MHQQGAVEGELLNPLPALQIVPAIATGELAFSARFFGHLEEQQEGQLSDVLVVRDAVVAQHVAEVPQFGNDVLGGHVVSPWRNIPTGASARRPYLEKATHAAVCHMASAMSCRMASSCPWKILLSR